MNQKDKLARLVSIDNSVLGSVAGGKGLDVWGSWAFKHLTTDSCYNAVEDAAAYAGYKVSGRSEWSDDAWKAANSAANDVWNGPACSYYGW